MSDIADVTPSAAPPVSASVDPAPARPPRDAPGTVATPPPTDDDDDSLSLRKALEAAVDETLVDDDKPKRHEVRDPPTGKFAPKPGEVAAASADPAKSVDPNAPAQEAAPVTDNAFADWDETWQGKFKALAPDVQKVVAESHNAIFESLRPALKEAAEIKDVAQRYYAHTKPMMEKIEAANGYLDRRASDLGGDHSAVLAGALQQEATLAYGRMEQKEQLFKQMAEVYGLSHLLGQAQPAQPADPYADLLAQAQGQQPAQRPAFDPRARELHDMQQENLRMKHELERVQSYEARAREHADAQKYQSAWTNFATEAGPDGQPLRPFANELQPSIVALVQQGQARNAIEAYDMLAKPMNDRLEAAAKAKADAALKASQEANRLAVEKARRTAPIKVSGVSRNGATTPSLRDIISEAMN